MILTCRADADKWQRITTKDTKAAKPCGKDVFCLAISKNDEADLSNLNRTKFYTVALLGDASECIGHNFYFAFRGIAGSNVWNGFLQAFN